jgi:hypothetical protein
MLKCLFSFSLPNSQVYIKYKCGSAPQVTHFYVLLYLDRLMARPVEIWQVRFTTQNGQLLLDKLQI